MTRHSKLQNKFSLQEITLYELAKVYWGDFVLREIIDGKRVIFYRETAKLVAHRETVVKKLPRASDLPKQLRKKLNNAIISLQQGYREALIWEAKCQNFLPFTILNPITAGPYQAGCFIDSMGHFNDLSWAKLFVSDKNQMGICRFAVACLYCLEEQITDLWHAMKTNGQSLNYIFECTKSSELCILIEFWDKFIQFSNECGKDVCESVLETGGFYTLCFEEAISSGLEHTARFFWSRCSNWQRAKFLREPDFYRLSEVAFYDHAGLVNYIYSLLPLEDKYNLIFRSIQNNGHNILWIWTCLLHSPFYEIALQDILNFPFPIPSVIYKNLLVFSTYKMKTLKIPSYQTIFKALWNHLTHKQQIEVFETKELFDDGSYIIISLVELNAMDLLKMIIQPLPHSEKEKMLLYDWQRAGKSALENFSKVGNYDALLQYLLLFFIDCNPVTNKLNLRDDATDFLHQFIKGDFFVAWTTKQIPESEEKEVNKVMESVQISLQVLHELLDQVEEMDCVITFS